MGVAGGVVCDVLCNEGLLVFKGELHATAALAGACIMIALDYLAMEAGVAALAGSITVFAVRLAGIHSHITLPTLPARR
jgi:uncharacterized membrane protein YeiH